MARERPSFAGLRLAPGVSGWWLVACGLGCSGGTGNPGNVDTGIQPDDAVWQFPSPDAPSDDGAVDAGEEGPQGVCQALPDGAPCDDGDLCTQGDFCMAGVCLGGERAVCPTPQAPCIESLRCDPSTGKCSITVFSDPGTPCDSDQDVCTFERCDGAGSCVPTGQREGCEAEQAAHPCWLWVCDAQSGCVMTRFQEGAACDDTDPCTDDDRCRVTEQGGVCQGSPVAVDDANPCTQDSCEVGVIRHEPLDGTPCDDGDPGTTNDRCVDGACVCVADCQGKECGGDGCGGSCGTCDPGEDCVEHLCVGCTPVDGGWSDWQWGPCSVPCGGGVQTGVRTCSNPPPSCGGADCQGPATTQQSCNPQPCSDLLPVGTTVYTEGEQVVKGRVPPGKSTIAFSLWGGGGGGGWPGHGGGGAYVAGVLAVQPGDEIEIRVGGGGGHNGGGGGASYVFKNGSVAMVAAGGGGAGSDGCSGCSVSDQGPEAGSGGGGGPVGGMGQIGLSNNHLKTNSGGGTGGTQFMGGLGGVSNNQSPYSTCTMNGEAGGPHTGGRSAVSACQWGTAAQYHIAGLGQGGNGHGGGGGAGWFGGGSGASMWTYSGGGGGGGSSWVGNDVSGVVSEGSTSQIPGGEGQPGYQAPAGRGGKGASHWPGEDSEPGQPGMVIMTL